MISDKCIERNKLFNFMICRKDNMRINRYCNLKNIYKSESYTYITLIPMFKRYSTEYILNELQIEQMRLIWPNSQGCRR